MHKQIRLLLSVFSIIVSVSITTAQNRTFSPNTGYGIGEINYRGYGRIDAMANTAIGVRSPQYLNNLNPASYSAIDSMAFYFVTGASAGLQNISQAGETQSFSDLNFDYFAVGFPISKKFALSVGIKPIAQSGYHFENFYSKDNELIKQTALGLGNITSAYTGLSYKVNPKLSFGVHASFWFGNLKKTFFSEFVDDSSADQFGQKIEHHINSLILDLGVQYSLTSRLTVGAIVRPKIALNGETTSVLASGRGNILDGNLFPDADTISMDFFKWNNDNFELPFNIGLGLSYNIENNLTVAADYSTQRWENLNFPDDITETTNTHLTSLGIEWIPNERTGQRYIQRIRYRTGIHYYADYLKINGYQLNDYGISFGLGLPLRRSNTSINFGFVYGKRLTSEKDQISESYSRFTLDLNMHEIWFRKRKFD